MDSKYEIPEPLLLTLDDAAWLLQISRSTVSRYIKMGLLKTTQPSSRVVRINRTEIERFCLAHQVQEDHT